MPSERRRRVLANWSERTRKLEAERDAERQRAQAATDLLRRLVDTGRDLKHSPAFRMAYAEARAFLSPESEAP